MCEYEKFGQVNFLFEQSTLNVMLKIVKKRLCKAIQRQIVEEKIQNTYYLS